MSSRENLLPKAIFYLNVIIRVSIKGKKCGGNFTFEF